MKYALLFLSAVIVFVACDSANQKMSTTPSGIQYQVFHLNDSGKNAPMMATAKVAVRHFGNNSMAVNGMAINDDSAQASAIKMPLYQMVLPPAPLTTDALAEIMVTTGVREGDSLITITKDNKKTTYKIIKIFIPGQNGLNTDSLIAIDKNEELKLFTSVHAQRAGKRINNYLQKNNITAAITNDQVFAEILDKGNGPQPDSGKKVGIHFTIKNLYTNKIINSNKDTAFHQPPILEYELLKGFMLKPVDRVIMQLGKGGSANIYIPAAIALGHKAAEPGADLSQDMLFQVELVSVK